MEKMSDMALLEEEEVKYFDLVYFRDAVIAEVEKLDKLKSQHRSGKFESMSCIKAVEYFLSLLLSFMPHSLRRKFVQDLGAQYDIQSMGEVTLTRGMGGARLQSQQPKGQFPGGPGQRYVVEEEHSLGFKDYMTQTQAPPMRKDYLPSGEPPRTELKPRNKSKQSQTEDRKVGSDGREGGFSTFKSAQQRKQDVFIQQDDDDFEVSPRQKSPAYFNDSPKKGRGETPLGENHTYEQIERQAVNGYGQEQQKHQQQREKKSEAKPSELAQLIVEGQFEEVLKEGHEHHVQNETILNFAKVGERLVVVEAGKKKARLLDLKTMQEVRVLDQVNDRMFKAYEFDGVAYMTFYDVPKIAAFELDNYQKNLKLISTKEGFSSLAKLKEGFLVVGENTGLVQIVSTKKREVTQTFKCQEEKDILELFVTTRGNEVCMSTLGGIKFANLVEKSSTAFQFKENEDEQYFPNKISRSVLEYSKEMLITCLKAEPYIFCIDRLKKSVTRKVGNPSGDTNCFSLALIPDFSMSMFPFVCLRDRKGVSVINLNVGSGWQLITSPFNYEAGNTKRLEVYLNDAGNIEVLVSEFESKNSVLKKVTLPSEFRRAMQLLAQS